MSHDDAAKAQSHSKLVIRDIGLLLSGDMDRPILDADTIVAIDGRIVAIGKAKDVDTSGAHPAQWSTHGRGANRLGGRATAW